MLSYYSGALQQTYWLGVPILTLASYLVVFLLFEVFLNLLARL